MITIQLHGVTSVKWEKVEDDRLPRTLTIETLTGTQKVVLFRAQPKHASKPGEPDDEPQAAA